MQKFRDLLSRWEAGELSMMEAGELLGMTASISAAASEAASAPGLGAQIDLWKARTEAELEVAFGTLAHLNCIWGPVRPHQPRYL
jgi:hypothetical protein